jgi:hypothetical protein
MRVLLSEALCVWQRYRLFIGLKGSGLRGESVLTGRWGMPACADVDGAACAAVLGSMGAH